MPPTSPIEAIARRQRVIVIAGLILVSGLAWAFVLAGAGTGMSIWAMSTWQFPPPMDRPAMAGMWTPAYALTMLVMWWVMMVAMMLPSAAPMILVFSQVGQRSRSAGSRVGRTAWLAAGYCLAWLGFSVVAVVLQYLFEQVGLVHGMLMWSLDPWFSVALLLAAAIYQLSPLKHACLHHCRTPLAFVLGHWRPGRIGALRMGLANGVYCVGCCWFLMTLLFVGGIMNVIWMAGLALMVLIEKIAPNGRLVSNILAALFLAGAAYIAISAGLRT